MQLEHLPAALEIISAHDEDDAECAEQSYSESLAGQYIFHQGSTILGVTGYDISGDIGNISWTYIAEQHRKQGHGTAMLEQLLKMLKKKKIRKVYVQTSDYRDAPWNPMLYGNAIALYKKLGFKQEAYHPHYHEKDDGMMIFGIRIGAPPLVANHPSRPNADGIHVCDVFLLEETKTTYAIDWDEDSSEPLTTEQIQQAIDRAKSMGATTIFISFPSTFSLNIYSIISNAGFREEAQLTDYHADGIHEVRYRYNITDSESDQQKPTYPTSYETNQ